MSKHENLSRNYLAAVGIKLCWAGHDGAYLRFQLLKKVETGGLKIQGLGNIDPSKIKIKVKI